MSYSIQDLVMFGPEVFFRLFVRINQDVWPWPLLGAVVALAIPLLLLNDCRPARRLGLALVGLAWVTSGYGFLVSYFGPINWPAEGLGWAFVAQGVLFALMAASGRVHPIPARAGLFITGWILAVLCLPWLTVVESGGWRALGLFGLAPGTTAAAGVLALACVGHPWRWACLPVPVLWAVFSAATFWGLQTFWLLVLPAATLITLGLAVWLSPRPGRSPG